MMRIAVVGHVEWVEFARVDHVPLAGEIIQGEPQLSVAAGGGAVAAVAMARWGADTRFFTALGNDDVGHRAGVELRARGVTVHAADREAAHRRAWTMVDAARERTIVVLGDRLVPRGGDRLPWDEIASCAAVYVTGGDVDAVRAARAARVVVATSRILPLLRAAAIQIDALVGSVNDPIERYTAGDLDPLPHFVVRTNGSSGGTVLLPDGSEETYSAVPCRVTGDTYGAGDTFAAALTYGLGEGKLRARAIAFAAQRATEVLAFRGPYPP